VDYQFLMLTLAGTGLILGAAVSERRVIAQQLRDKQFELDRSLRLASASELASAMAHELQQPLTALGNYVRASALMAGRPDVAPDEIAATMRKALAEADRAGQVVRRLRDFFRAGTVHAESIDAAELVTAAAEVMRERSRRHAVEVVTDIEVGLPRIHADRLQLEGVLQNLLSNAIDALKTAASPHRLTIDVRRDDDGMAMFTVEDNGPGVAPEITERLFGHFATSKPRGMGLGLAIARSVIEAHGGRIWHEPRSPGSAFRFTLPTTERHG
jgi:signal transduction histidine kinase